jgi:hypothetical protein
MRIKGVELTRCAAEPEQDHRTRRLATRSFFSLHGQQIAQGREPGHASDARPTDECATSPMVMALAKWSVHKMAKVNRRRWDFEGAFVIPANAG